MELTGKIISVLPEQSGVSKAGNSWKKREYVLETIEQYPRKVHFTLFGDKADQYPLNVGEVKKVSFDLESREFNGRWYTDVRAWKVEMQAPPQEKQVAPLPKAEPIKAPDPSTVDSLPF